MYSIVDYMSRDLAQAIIVDYMSRNLAQAIDVAEGSARYHQIVGYLTELVNKCIEEIETAGGDNVKFHCDRLRQEVLGEYVD